MSSAGIALVILVGTMIGVYVNYPKASIWGLLVLGLLNGGFAYFVLKLATWAWPLFKKQ